MIDFSSETIASLFEHAAKEAPRECCGLVVVRKGKERYWPCRNRTPGLGQFQMHAEDYAAAEDAGDVIAVAHSHVYAAPTPSQADLTSCEVSGLPWIIVNWPVGHRHIFEPSGYETPLIGCQFSHGVNDCYSLIRRYYQRELSITLPDFEREDDWWKTDKNLYVDNFATAGFVRIDDASLRQHDVILMRLGADVTNHGAVYLGQNLILHHPMRRLSGRDPFGGMWHKISSHYLRHKDVP